MQVLILTTCTGRKTLSNPQQLTGEDFEKGMAHVRERAQKLPTVRAEDLYAGMAYRSILRGVAEARERGHQVDLAILSCPGWGLIRGRQKIAPYNYMWHGWSEAQAQRWSKERGIARKVQALVAEPYDLIIVHLSPRYLAACNFAEGTKFGGKTVFVVSNSNSALRLRALHKGTVMFCEGPGFASYQETGQRIYKLLRRLK